MYATAIESLAHRLDESQPFLCPVHQAHLLWPTLIST